MSQSTPVSATKKVIGTDHIALLLLLALGTVWGVAPSMAKLGTSGGVPPFAFAFWQSFGGAVLLSCLAAWRRKWPTFSREFLLYYLIAGVGGHLLPQTNMIFVVQHVPAGVVSLAIATAPLLTYLLALIFRFEPASARRIIGLLLGVAGVLMIVLPRTDFNTGSSGWWVAQAFVTPVCFAFSNLALVKLRPSGEDPLTSALSMLFIAMIVTGPLMLLTTGPYIPQMPFGSADYAVFIQMVLVGVAFALFFSLLHRAGPVYLSTVNFIVMMTGIGWGMLLFDERHGLWVIAALVSIMIGIAMMQKKPVANAQNGQDD